MRKMILRDMGNGCIVATFTYNENPNDFNIFISKQKEGIKNKFGSHVFLRFDGTEIKGMPQNKSINLYATFSGIDVNEIKETLEKEFPLVGVIGG